MRSTWEEWEDQERYPGKFEGNGSHKLASRLHEITMEGTDEELGESEGFGWYGLIIDDPEELPAPAFIVNEDSQGFFSYTPYDSIEEAREAWGNLEREYSEWVEEGVQE